MTFTKTTKVTTPSWTNASGEFKILQEDGFNLLLETGASLLNEIGRGLITWVATSENTTPIWSDARGWLWENINIKWEDLNMKWEEMG